MMPVKTARPTELTSVEGPRGNEASCPPRSRAGAPAGSAETNMKWKIIQSPLAVLAGIASALALWPASTPAAATCARTITADVVALDQPLMFNRLGAQNVNGMMFALRRDVVDKSSGKPLGSGGTATPGNVALRADKRPRPIVLRVAAGDCLVVNFQNLLSPAANPNNAPNPAMQVDDQVADRTASFHVSGLQNLASNTDDGSFVGLNAPGVVGPGGSTVYRLYAEHEGAFLATSHGAVFGGEGLSGNSGQGLFGAVNVEPRGARFYRSQVTEEELRLARIATASTGQPIIDYEARYPYDCDANGVWCREGKAGLPVLNMLDGNTLVHTDPNAVIAGPNGDGSFPASTYPLESVGLRNPTLPNRLEAFREFTVVFHDEMTVANAFPAFYEDPVLKHTLHAVGDVFQINYGSGGVGSEVIANRLGVGPMHDCLDCAMEEFFLTSHVVGDPAMVVDVPANVGLETCGPAGGSCTAVGPKAQQAFYPDDPSNVRHSYMSDFVKFRNVHTGKEHHVFHLHNHQWLFNPNDDSANYLDAQGIGPGSGYTYEINFGGSGNRNKSAGDAIYHCHFYPHFAQGMWELWRVHDVFESGTPLAASGGDYHASPWELQYGRPAPSARALPDGEIVAGTPIPALVPVPGKGMAPLPQAAVSVVPKISKNPATGVEKVVGSNAKIERPTDGSPVGNPGYPFWIAGIEHTVGQRPPTPPLDMKANAGDPASGGWDGGLPRHTLDGVAAGGTFHATQTRLDFSKEMLSAKPVWFPEDGTDVEKAAMEYHGNVREHPTEAVRLDGTVVPASFVTNGSRVATGRAPQPGAPYHDPCVDDRGKLMTAAGGFFFDAQGGLGIPGQSRFNADSPRVYKGAVIQFDAVLNKAGYHYSQQRTTTLWEDAVATINKQRPPEPWVIRNNTFDCTMYYHTNLVPKMFELDDYQIRTPTDIIGQHIHLPKWDLTTTDGSANGWNYEDGTLAPDAVQERIHAINAFNPTGAGNPSDSKGRPENTPLVAQPHPFFGQFGKEEWLGARTTTQRWFFDPVVDVRGVDRGLGIIFTHDHYGPSSHQQVGLYSTVLTEPAGSTWVHNETGVPMYTRPDGGPTSWQAAILPPGTGDIDADGQNDAFREFYFEYSDFQHAYEPGVYVGVGQFGGPAAAPDANTFRKAVNTSVKKTNNPLMPDLLVHLATCPGGVPRPCPEGISADDPGYMVVNYRNEPIGLRVYDPAKLGPDGKPGAQADGPAGDLAFALQSRVDRKIPEMNVQPQAGTNMKGTIFPPPINAADVGPGDPFTPMLRAFMGDRIRVKIQAGGQEETHNATIHGVKWLQGGSGHGWSSNSGWRNAQEAGISEQFTFASPALPLLNGGNKADHLYSIDASQDGFWNGTWGIVRMYGKDRRDLFKLPNSRPNITLTNVADFRGVCPATAKVRTYDVTAVLANEALENHTGTTIVPADASATMHMGAALNPNGGTLVYNPRGTPLANGKAGVLHDPTAMMFVRTEDLSPRDLNDPGCYKTTKNGKAVLDALLLTCKVKLAADAPVEPIVLRAAAGECVEVLLRNKLPTVAPDLGGYMVVPPIVTRDANSAEGTTSFQNNLIRPSSYVGLHTGLLAYDTNKDDGVVVGNNASSTVVAPGGTLKYRWYAGDLSLVPQGGDNFAVAATPVEFGGATLTSADKIKQPQKGLVGAVVVLPEGSTWTETDTTVDHQRDTMLGYSRKTRASATVTKANGQVVRDFASVWQRGVNLKYKDGTPIEEVASEGIVTEDSEDSGHMAINYGAEPMWLRFGLSPNAPFNHAGAGGHGGPGPGYGDVPNAHEAFSSVLTGGTDPVTPVFTADAGQELRLHVLEPAGVGRGATFAFHGHVWQRSPYVCPGSSYLGLAGNCKPTSYFPTISPNLEVGSRAIGNSPISMYLGGQESILPAAHFDIVAPAGGVNGVPGDYLFRDQAGFGITGGLWGIVRVK